MTTKELLAQAEKQRILYEEGHLYHELVRRLRAAEDGSIVARRFFQYVDLHTEKIDAPMQGGTPRVVIRETELNELREALEVTTQKE